MSPPFWVIVVLGAALLSIIGTSYFVMRILVRVGINGKSAPLGVGVLIPLTLLVIGSIVEMTSMEVDDPAPGNVLFGGAAVCMLLMPMTVLSALVAARRGRRQRP